ncbi:motility protein A [Stakelama saccharophila]|uniref:MotA/TolQ/ExbB proton channel family protein n=1 Tax=Stakelama saccharophila TaxID=3075605 RepID=A0ABZ0BBJ5_9SPHN|nr:MotA/TolQ/ExbB proton channel family protein [Stakelama sp. W311]WNO53679.1 MotA/TolQ/ExbB proton channel family protein [Stakelama sp. W311]
MTATISLPALMGPFLDPLALAIVLGGTALAVVLRTPRHDLGRAVGALAVLTRRPWSADETLRQIDALSRIADRHGVIQLDRSIIRDGDVAAAAEAIVDGHGPDTVRRAIAASQLARTERHLAAADTWISVAEIAPAMGMIGTLVGLVRLFIVMTDPTRIGGAMAVALLTTLYGAIIASLIAAPIAGRLRRLARIEALERSRLERPLVAFARRHQPRLRAEAA